jgi:hypothetical protein
VFHINLLRPHYPNDDVIFPNRAHVDAYDFGAPDNSEWSVNEIVGHHWDGRKLEFHVRWNLGDTTWEPYASCKELEALDQYLALMAVDNPKVLPKKVAHA